MNPCLAIDRILTDDERQRLLGAATRSNPHLRGAHAVDVIDIMNGADAFLDVSEPLWEEHGAEIPEALRARGLFGPAAIAAALIHGRAGATWGRVLDLMTRAAAAIE